MTIVYEDKTNNKHIDVAGKMTLPKLPMLLTQKAQKYIEKFNTNKHMYEGSIGDFVFQLQEKLYSSRFQTIWPEDHIKYYEYISDNKGTRLRERKLNLYGWKIHTNYDPIDDYDSAGGVTATKYTYLEIPGAIPTAIYIEEFEGSWDGGFVDNKFHLGRFRPNPGFFFEQIG